MHHAGVNVLKKDILFTNTVDKIQTNIKKWLEKSPDTLLYKNLQLQKIIGKPERKQVSQNLTLIFYLIFLSYFLTIYLFR